MRVLFIINPRSGTPKFIGRLHYLIRKHFGEHNRKVQVVRSRNSEHIVTLAQGAVEEGIDLVVAVGGDGTINLIAQVLINSDSILGVLPAGSGNGFARNLKIPLRLEKALEALKSFRVITIDTGKVVSPQGGEHIFLVSCGIGWESIIATVFDSSRIRGILPYATAAITTYLQYDPQPIQVRCPDDGWLWEGRPMLFTIANMKEYGVNATIAPSAQCDDGLLDLCLIPRQNLLDALKYAPEVFRQKPDAIPGYLHHQGSQFHIKRLMPANISLDGTPVFLGEELRVFTLPSSLKVAVPAR